MSGEGQYSRVDGNGGSFENGRVFDRALYGGPEACSKMGAFSNSRTV